jgi:alkylhydroperoxidase family enzyme
MQMQRLPYPDLSKHSDHVQKMVADAKVNAVRMMAHASPEVFSSFNKFASAIFVKSPLPADLRQIGILRAGYIAKAVYETTQHESVAKKVGLNEAQIAAIKKGGKHPGVLNDKQQAVLDFVEEFIVNVRPTDATLAAVRKHLTDEQLTDLMFITGVYMTVSRFLEVTGVPLDETLIDLDKVTKSANAL